MNYYNVQGVLVRSNKPARDKIIVERRLTGMSCREIGREHGISRSRVDQIYKKWRRLRPHEETASELAWRKRHEEVQRLLKEGRDKREAEEVARLTEKLLARERKFFKDLAETPAWEDAILHVQKVLGCDRETASQEILKRF